MISSSSIKLDAHIKRHPDIMAGQPVIKGTRLTVNFIQNLLAHGSSDEEIMEEYQGLTVKDIEACRKFIVPNI